MYKVINRFIDKEDKDTLYEVDEVYPKGDYKPTKKRVEVLLKEHPTYKCKFIKEIKEEKKPSNKG
jgi:hypothetical protein